jgi:hypothetical protein
MPQNQNSDLDAKAASLSAVIRDVFFSLKSQQLKGRQYRPDKRHDNRDVWMRAGRKCVEAGKSPEFFVNAAFSFCRTPGGPFPTHLGGDAIMRWCRMQETGFTMQTSKVTHSPHDGVAAFDPVGHSDEESKEYLINSLTHLMTYVKRRTGSDRVNLHTIGIIRDHTTPADPVTRVLVGYEDEHLMKEFYEQAERQMASRPSLERAAAALGFPVEEIKKRGREISTFYRVMEVKHA